jgi:hypothetical protein
LGMKLMGTNGEAAAWTSLNSFLFCSFRNILYCTRSTLG